MQASNRVATRVVEASTRLIDRQARIRVSPNFDEVERWEAKTKLAIVHSVSVPLYSYINLNKVFPKVPK